MPRFRTGRHDHAQRCQRCGDEGVAHRLRRLAGGDHVDGIGGAEPDRQTRIVESAAYESARVRRIQRGAGNLEKMLSEFLNDGGQLIYLARVAPGRQPGDDVELAKKTADDLVGIRFGAETIELGHDPGQGLLDVADRAFRIILTLLFETALAFDELFSVEIGKRVEHHGLALRASVGQEARQTVP
jgi:hypothetical protein